MGQNVCLQWKLDLNEFLIYFRITMIYSVCFQVAKKRHTVVCDSFSNKMPQCKVIFNPKSWMWHNEIKWFINKGVHLTWTDSCKMCIFVFPFALWEWGNGWLMNLFQMCFSFETHQLSDSKAISHHISHIISHSVKIHSCCVFFFFRMFRWTACKLSSKNVLHFVLITGLGTPFYKQSLSLSITLEPLLY